MKTLNRKTGVRFLLIVFSLSGMVCCSPEAGQKTLRIFFDGVPEETSRPAFMTTDTSGTPDSLLQARVNPHLTKNYYHLPYQEKQCDACHNQASMGKFTEPQPALCYQCHEDFGDRYKVLHGPVAAGYCTLCHSPHFAKDSTLLIRSGQDLCFYCHRPGETFDTEIHDGIEDTDCTECHNPHGGESRELMQE